MTSQDLFRLAADATSGGATLSIKDILTLLLGGGATATIVALFKGIRSIQTGARAREKDTVTDLVQQRKEAWRDRDFAQDERDYWRNRAGMAEYAALTGGVKLPEFTDPPKPTEETNV